MLSDNIIFKDVYHKMPRAFLIFTTWLKIQIIDGISSIFNDILGNIKLF